MYSIRETGINSSNTQLREFGAGAIGERPEGSAFRATGVKVPPKKSIFQVPHAGGAFPIDFNKVQRAANFIRGTTSDSGDLLVGGTRVYTRLKLVHNVRALGREENAFKSRRSTGVTDKSTEILRNQRSTPHESAGLERSTTIGDLQKLASSAARNAENTTQMSSYNPLDHEQPLGNDDRLFAFDEELVASGKTPPPAGSSVEDFAIWLKETVDTTS